MSRCHENILTLVKTCPVNWVRYKTPITGKRKGGIKVHTQINLQEKVPRLIWFSPATTHDKQFLKHLQLEIGKIAVFDKGYNDYKTFDEFTLLLE